jgi:hypothetical protein
MKVLSPLILVVLFSFNIYSTFAQTWNQEQTEVWNVMVEVYDAVKSSDLEKYKSLLHEKFTMWLDTETFPSDRTTHDIWEANWMAVTDVKIVDILPLKIIVVDHIAVVHHLAKSLIVVEGKTAIRQAKWTDVLINENDKWVLITSNGSVLDE